MYLCGKKITISWRLHTGLIVPYKTIYAIMQEKKDSDVEERTKLNLLTWPQYTFIIILDLHVCKPMSGLFLFRSSCRFNQSVTTMLRAKCVCGQGLNSTGSWRAQWWWLVVECVRNSDEWVAIFVMENVAFILSTDSYYLPWFDIWV